MTKTCIYDGEICVRAFSFVKEGSSDSDAIELAIAYAKSENIYTILIDGQNWLIDRAILFYEGVTIIVDGVVLKQADGTFDNVFRSEGFIVNEREPYGYPVDVRPVCNFRLIGKRGASIEGPDAQPLLYNADTGAMVEPVGDVWGWRGISVYFTCCSGFEFSGFTVRKTRSWAISMERSKEGIIKDTKVYSTCPNGDGINIRNGCSFIVIDGFKGVTSDDAVAINNCSIYRIYPRRTWKTYFYPIVASNILMKRGESVRDQDIHNITVSNVTSNSAVMFLARNGHKIYNIRVNNLDDGTAFSKRENVAHMVGAYYGEGYGDISKECCLSDICIENVVTRGTQSSVLFRDNVKNLVVKNVKQYTPGGTVLTAKDEDMIVMEACESVGDMRRSARDWKDPN